MPSNLPRVVHVNAPAKLNVFLELLGRREDGFHELETIMIAVNRFDRIEAEVSIQPGICFHCDWLPHHSALSRRYRPETPDLNMPQGGENLALRAATKFCDGFGITKGFRLVVRKSIPAGAGMGGASSDAAATLLALATLCGIDSKDPALLAMAAELGSDVPFFLGGRFKSSMACATGRGERVESLRDMGGLHFVVVHPPESVSTAKVYAACQVPGVPEDSASLRSAVFGQQRGGFAKNIHNRLAEPAGNISAWVQRTIKLLRRQPVMASQVTGSGSACFGVCRSAIEARRIANRIASMGIGLTFPVKPVSLPSQKWLLT